MKKVSIFFAVAVFVTCLCGSGFAGNVKGSLQCSSGASAEGAVVYLPGDSFSSITDEAGDFFLRAVPAGLHSLKVKMGEEIVTTIRDVRVRTYRETDLGTVMVNCEGSCSVNTDCASGEFCAKPLGDCGGKGVCQRRPDVCMTLMYEPVCGCDGRNYSAGCDAASHGVNLAHMGLCK